jgi:ubiquinone/menaquinone biosynthesis C-methylase UbiE
MAAVFDRWAAWIAGRRRLVSTVAAELPRADDAVVIDIAAGDGAFSELVASQTGGRLITHDISRHECTACAANGHEAVRGDARHLPFADHTADVTIAFEIIEHFERWEAEAVVGELARITKPGGTVLISTPNRYSLESLKGMLRFLWDGTVWNARDETHLHIFNRSELLRMLRPQMRVRKCYGYYPVPEIRHHGLPGTYAITTNPAIANICFLLLVSATPIVSNV